MSTYLTDSWSTITGLASVSYGSPDRYTEVANQVRAKSVMSFLSPILPSAIVADKLSVDNLTSALQAEYDAGEGFAQYIDERGSNIATVATDLYDGVLSAYNEIASYETSLIDAVEYAMGDMGIDARRLVDTLINSASDLELSSRMAASVPLAKLDKLPAGTRIELDDNTPLDVDERGISVSTGYLTPDQYFSDIAYPGAGRTADDLPSSIVKSVSEGYRGYATLQPLDDLLRPGLATLLSLADIRDVNNVSRAVAGLGTLDTLRDLTGLGSMNPADRAMYGVDDLASLVVEMNGYTVYDPLTDSSGDYINPALIPDYSGENADPGGGLTPSTRPRTSPF